MEIKYTVPGKTEDHDLRKAFRQKQLIFDETGFIKEIRLYSNGAEHLISKFIREEDGRLLQMNEYLTDGTLNLSVNYSYDEKGFKSEALYNWSENRVIGEICERFDYYDDILQNELFTRVEYKNEYRGYCTQESFYTGDGRLSFKIESKYDFRGNRLESAYLDGNGRLSWITKYKYDRYDHLIESNVYKSNRIAVESGYKYKFDDSGNWVSRAEDRTVYVNILTAGIEKSDMLAERIIDYY
jgi:YD repeat-containing protein